MATVLERYGYLMAPEYRALNESRQQSRDRLDFDKSLQQMKKEIMNELKPYIDQAASKSIDIQVKNNATPALRELAAEMKNLGFR